MGRLTEHDLTNVTAFLRTSLAGTIADPLPRPLLVELRDLTGADEAEYFEMRRTDRSVVAAARSHDWSDPAWMDEAIAANGHENPLGWRRWGPSDGAVRLSARVSRRDLRRNGFYNAVMRPERLTDTLKVWLWSSNESVACVQLWRHGGLFSRRDEDVLAVLQSHLVHARAVALGREPAPPRTEVSLTLREAEILIWAATGASDADIASRLGMSEATVGKHLEHAYEKLDVHSRSEALWRLSRQRPEIS